MASINNCYFSRRVMETSLKLHILQICQDDAERPVSGRGRGDGGKGGVMFDIPAQIKFPHVREMKIVSLKEIPYSKYGIKYARFSMNGHINISKLDEVWIENHDIFARCPHWLS